MLTSARVIDGDSKRRTLTVEFRDGAREVRYGRLILATGAREFFLPFPGWTLPNVMGVGGLQALAKSGLPLAGKRIVVAGTGPLLLAASAYFRHCGATVPLIAEQAGSPALARFALHFVRYPGKLLQAVALRAALRGSRYRTSCRVEVAEGNNRVESVLLRRGGRLWRERCDYLAIAYGFKPNIELPALLGCRLGAQGVVVDALQRTSVDGIYCAGETTGIGGVDLSIVEGEIAGYAAAGKLDTAAKLVGRRNRALRFAGALERAFALRDDLRALPQPDTIVCRCEDITWGRLQEFESWRAAKLQTRCGMGPCQGRICGPIVEYLLGFGADSVWPPVFPARLETLVAATKKEKMETT